MANDRTVNAFLSLRLPPPLVDALVALQETQRERVDPQDRDRIHVTLGFLHDADAGRLADAAALLSDGDWAAPRVRLTGEVRHGSWRLQKDPAYRYDSRTVQRQEQVRLGIEHTQELATLYAGTVRRLGIEEGDFWPHLTLGLAKYDFPTEEAEAMDLPSVTGAASGVELQQEMSVTEFRVLVDKPLV
ncbi:2'-5' RNA ligase family protein [Streptomyces sp. NPDC015237]|uniref:2'-5' RNA ligase family protein n=1 Tax=Streptomyces sp. NPDC015237 TaxID=3364949 RepID=UPI0036F970F1